MFKISLQDETCYKISKERKFKYKFLLNHESNHEMKTCGRYASTRKSGTYHVVVMADYQASNLHNTKGYIEETDSHPSTRGLL
jgi:hypothetical protein